MHTLSVLLLLQPIKVDGDFIFSFWFSTGYSLWIANSCYKFCCGLPRGCMQYNDGDSLVTGYHLSLLSWIPCMTGVAYRYGDCPWYESTSVGC